jgi:hypothetical protein
MNQAGSSAWLAHSDPETRNKQVQAILSALVGLKPQDEAEGMLVAQMIACHNAAMECFRRAMLPEQTFEGQRQALNFGNKLARTYALHLEALDKHRGKGQQRVTVEHVHIHQGGQAIVGEVHTAARKPSKSEDRTHAIAHAPEPEMRRAFETDRQPVLLPRDEEW